MQLLVLGGTAYVGREVARAALAAGHSVTCLARGESGPVADGARLVVSDRDQPGAYDAVVNGASDGQPWDAVVDVARHPAHVRGAVAALAASGAHYLFVSSINVYLDSRQRGLDESAPLEDPLDDDYMPDMSRYGAAKVACERAVTEGFGPERSCISRAGLIVGDGDWSGRLGYWPWRFKYPSNPEGRVLVPETEAYPCQLIDVRDMAEWLVRSAERRTAGIFNVSGRITTLATVLDAARRVAGHTGPVVRVSPRWLGRHGVGSWMGPRSLPLWIDDPGGFAFMARSVAKALDAGLTLRPLDETVAAALAYEERRPADVPRAAGLTDDEERQLLNVLAT